MPSGGPDEPTSSDEPDPDEATRPEEPKLTLEPELTLERKAVNEPKTPVQATPPDRQRPRARAGEAPEVRFRSDRFFTVDGLWYFATREGIDVGPFDSRQMAETEAARLIELLAQCSTDEDCQLTIREFRWRPKAF